MQGHGFSKLYFACLSHEHINCDIYFSVIETIIESSFVLFIKNLFRGSKILKK